MLNRQAPRRQDVFLRWPEMLLRQIRYDLQASDRLPGTRASAKIIRMVREKLRRSGYLFIISTRSSLYANPVLLPFQRNLAAGSPVHRLYCQRGLEFFLSVPAKESAKLFM